MNANDEFVDLFYSALNSEDPDERIDLIQAAMAEEARIGEWLLDHRREDMKAALFVNLGQSYLDRGRGLRAENVELAIKALESAPGAGLFSSADIGAWKRER